MSRSIPRRPMFKQEIGKNKGYEYARVSNPTRDRLEENLASLEGGIGSKVFASGMAAINAIATMFKSGDHVICGHNLYGGTPRLFNQVLANFGMEFTYVDTSDVNNVERAIRKNTRMVFVETPTNPLMALSDLQAIAKVCHARKVRSSRRQHVHVALLSAAARAWRGHGGAFHNKVPQWS